jgi:hypothetical protein
MMWRNAFKCGAVASERRGASSLTSNVMRAPEKNRSSFQHPTSRIGIFVHAISSLQTPGPTLRTLFTDCPVIIAARCDNTAPPAHANHDIKPAGWPAGTDPWYYILGLHSLPGTHFVQRRGVGRPRVRRTRGKEQWIGRGNDVLPVCREAWYVHTTTAGDRGG